MAHTPVSYFTLASEPTVFARAQDALAQLQRLYQQQIDHLRKAMQAYVEGQDFPQPVRAWYPLLRIQALADLQRDFGMAMVLITHDLGVVAEVARLHGGHAYLRNRVEGGAEASLWLPMT